MTPTKRAGAALVAAQECGGALTARSSSDVELAQRLEGKGAVKAAAMDFHALWVTAAPDAVQHDEMCARAFRNGFIE